MGPMHTQQMDDAHDKPRRASIQDLAVDLGGPSLRERNSGAGTQWLLAAAAGASLAFWFFLRG